MDDEMVSAEEAREMAEACSYATIQPWEMEDDGDDYVIVSSEAAVEIARVPHSEGAEADAQHIVNAVNFAPRACATVVALHTDVANRDARIAALTEALRAVLDLAPEGGTPWVAAMARAQRVLDGGAR